MRVRLGKPDFHVVALAQVVEIVAALLVAGVRHEADAADDRIALETLGRERLGALRRQLQVHARLAVVDRQGLGADIGVCREDQPGDRIEHGAQVALGNRDPVLRPVRLRRRRRRCDVAVAVDDVIGMLLACRSCSRACSAMSRACAARRRRQRRPAPRSSSRDRRGRRN